MPPTSCCRGRVRPSAVVNAEIRLEVDGARFEQRAMDRDRYTALLEEWAEAQRREMVEAA